jgi:hypothetical protein
MRLNFGEMAQHDRGVVRISFGIGNTLDDADALVAGLDAGAGGQRTIAGPLVWHCARRQEPEVWGRSASFRRRYET